MTARLQHQPASSRATATAATVERLPRASKLRQRRCRRRSAASARSRTSGRLALAAARQLTARARGRPPLVPGGLDEEAPGVAVAGLGDRPLAAALAGGALAGHEAQVGADRAPVEALPVADLAWPGRRRSGWRRRAGRRGGRRRRAQGSLRGLLAIAASRASRRARTLTTAARPPRRRAAGRAPRSAARRASARAPASRPSPPRRAPGAGAAWRAGGGRA